MRTQALNVIPHCRHQQCTWQSSDRIQSLALLALSRAQRTPAWLTPTQLMQPCCCLPPHSAANQQPCSRDSRLWRPAWQPTRTGSLLCLTLSMTWRHATLQTAGKRMCVHPCMCVYKCSGAGGMTSLTSNVLLVLHVELQHYFPMMLIKRFTCCYNNTEPASVKYDFWFVDIFSVNSAR